MQIRSAESDFNHHKLAPAGVSIEVTADCYQYQCNLQVLFIKINIQLLWWVPILFITDYNRFFCNPPCNLDFTAECDQYQRNSVPARVRVQYITTAETDYSSRD